MTTAPTVALSTIAAAVITGNARSFPRMVEKVRMMVADPSCSAQVLTSVILSDPIMSAVILSRANTAGGINHEGTTRVSAGVVFLGLASVYGIAQEIESIEDVHRSRLANSWSAANGCAAMARLLVKHCGVEPEETDPESLYVHGLLSQLGVIYSIQCFHDTFNRLVSTVPNEKGTIPEIEQRLLGLSSGDIGALLAKSWHLPESLIDVIRYNQRPLGAKKYPLLVALVHVARILAQGCGFAASHEVYVPNIDPEIMDMLGLSSVDISACINEFFEEQEEIALYESIYSSQSGGSMTRHGV